MPNAPPDTPWTTRLRASGALRAWLAAPGSLSAQLARVFGDLTVQRGHQGRGRLRRDEAGALGLAAGRRVHVREVTLRCAGRPLVSARTVVEPAALKGPWRALRGLGSRPLAELLFHDHRVRRLAPSYARIRLGSTLGRRLAAAWQQATGQTWQGAAVWARRAVYVRRGRPLLVAELFDPATADQRPAAAARRR